jgi:hypothetical protein
MGELNQKDKQDNVNVTLCSLGDLVDQEFPCPLCGAGLPIQRSKREKPYCICNLCGLQLFIRGKQGIKRMREMADSGILISGKKESAMHGINLLNWLEQLKIQKRDLEMKQGIIFRDENVDNAIQIVDAETKKVEGELAEIAEKAKKENEK